MVYGLLTEKNIFHVISTVNTIVCVFLGNCLSDNATDCLHTLTVWFTLA